MGTLKQDAGGRSDRACRGIGSKESELPPRRVPRVSFPEPGTPGEAQSWHMESGVPLPHSASFTASPPWA